MLNRLRAIVRKRRALAALRRGRLWIVDDCVEYVEDLSLGEMDILEFGAGSSTFWWLRRVRELTSVEADPAWISLILDEIGDDFALSKKLTLKHVRAQWNKDELSNRWFMPECLASTPLSDKEISRLENEYAYIDRTKNYDLIFVDGSVRADCVKSAVDYLTARGKGFLLVDNTEKPWRDRYTRQLIPTEWVRTDFTQTADNGWMVEIGSRSTIWKVS